MQPLRHENHADRPDPDEPWRYACPECGTVRVHANANNEKPSREASAYCCERCHASFDEPIDKKQKPPPRAGGSAIVCTDD